MAGNVNADKDRWGHLTIQEMSNFEPVPCVELNNKAAEKFRYELLLRTDWIVSKDVNIRYQVYSIRPADMGETILTEAMFTNPGTSKIAPIAFTRK